MPIPAQVFSRAFSGVGHNDGCHEGFPRFRKLAKRYRKVDLRQAASSKRSETRLGEYLPSYSTGLRVALDGATLGIASASERAGVSYFGRRLVEIASRALPGKFLRDALTWQRTSSAKRQREILSQLLYEIRMPCSAQYLEDMANQPSDRVLPNSYCNWSLPNSIKPNCLGKAQIVSAFLRLAGAEAYAATVIVPRGQERSRLASDLFASFECAFPKDCREILESADACGYMGYLAKRYEEKFQEQTFAHFAVIVRLKDGSWLFCDPNYELCVELPADFQMDEVRSELKARKLNLPGATVLRRSTCVEESLKLTRRQAEFRAFTQFLENASRYALGPSAAVEMLSSGAMLGIYRQLVSSYLQRTKPGELEKRRRELSKKRDLTDRECAKFMLLLGHSQDQKSEQSLEDLARSRNWAKGLNAETVRKSLASQANSFVGALVHDITADIEARDTVHPVLEIGHVEQLLAVHTLRHIGVDLKQVGQASRALLAHGFSQYLLHDVLVTTTESGQSPKRQDQSSVSLVRCEFEAANAQCIEAILRALPYRLRSAEFVLGNSPERSCVTDV